MSEQAAAEHRPGCPAAYFTDHPERCRCVLLAVCDQYDAKKAALAIAHDAAAEAGRKARGES